MHAIATAVTAVVMRIAQTRFTAGELYSWDADTTAVTFGGTPGSTEGRPREVGHS
jgi:hypothetical protein